MSEVSEVEEVNEVQKVAKEVLGHGQRQFQSNETPQADEEIQSGTHNTQSGMHNTQAENPSTISDVENKDQWSQFIDFILNLQSVLSQFVHPKVRGDFVKGKFGCLINTAVLPLVDKLRALLFPRWNASQSIRTNTSRLDTAKLHLKSLFLKFKTVFKLVVEEEQVLSYEDCYVLLNNIAKNNYWSKYAPVCVHIVNSDLSSETESNGVMVKKEKMEIKPKIVKKRVSRGKVSAKKVIETILVSSNESSALTDSSTSSTESDSVIKTRRKRDNRETVVPPRFEMSGRIDLVTYLATYETYFYNKFKGNEYDQTQELANFLDGKILQVYNIRGGRRVKYSKMKRELIHWYKKQKVGGKAYWRREIADIAVSGDETFDLLAMRLMELYHLAYPNVSSEKSTELRETFLNLLPSEVKEKVLDTERAVKASVNGSGSRMKFSAIVELATEIQGELPQKEKRVNWTRPTINPTPVESNDHRGRTTRYFSRGRSTSSSTDRRNLDEHHQQSSREQFCTYCKKKYHRREDCWRRSRSCLICGRDHSMQQCPRFDPNFGRRSNDTNEQQHYNLNR